MPRTGRVDNEALQAEIARLRVELAACRLEAARQTERHVQMALAAAIEALADPVFLHDREGRIEHANRAYLALVGREFAQVVGRPYWELFPRGDGPTPGCRQAIREGGVQEEEIAGPDGTVWRMRSFPMCDDAAGWCLPYSLHILEDVTEHKRHEAVLRESEERLRLALNAAKAGIWDWNLHTGTVVWSRENYRLHGIVPTRAAPSFAEWERCLHPDDRARTVRDIRDAIAGPPFEYHTEFRVIHPRHGVRWLLGIGRVERAADGTPQRLLGISLDVTDRKTMEESLRHANAELQRLTYVASHDLKGPLRAVHGLSSWIEEEVAGHLSDAGKERMRLLRDRVRLMDVLINAMLDYSRAGAQIGDLEEVEVAALVAQVAGDGERPAGFTVSIAPDLPRLRTDREHLRQVFANLIGNAMAHHPGPDGHLWVSAQDRGTATNSSSPTMARGSRPNTRRASSRCSSTDRARHRAQGSGWRWSGGWSSASVGG